MKLLLIDDDIDFLILCKKYFKRYDDSIDVFTISNPEDIVTNFSPRQVHDFNVIISDYQMRGIDGVLIYNYLKINNIVIPFILISSSEYGEIRRKYSHPVCDYFIQKKLTIDEFFRDLFECLKKIIQSPIKMDMRNLTLIR